MEDFINSYPGFLRYARCFFGGVNLSFNEYDIVHDVFLKFHSGELKYSIKKEIVSIFHKERRTLGKGDLVDGRYRLNIIREDFRFCSSCAEDLPIAAFRVRETDQVVYNALICLNCEKKVWKDYYDKRKNDTKVKEKTKTRTLEYYYKNREKILKRQKEERESGEKKEYLYNWRRANSERVKALAREAQKRYYNKKNLTVNN